MTRSVVVPTTACIGGSSSLGISPLCAMKGYESQLFKLSQAVGLIYLFILDEGCEVGKKGFAMQFS